MPVFKSVLPNMRIKHKMFLLVSSVVTAVGMLSLLLLQYALRVYEDEIYQQSAKALSLTSFGIENELKRIEEMSYNVVVDPLIQKNLSAIRDGAAEYERYVITTMTTERLVTLGALEKYVLSLHLYDVNGQEYAVGSKREALTDARMREIREKAVMQQGGVAWVPPDPSDFALAAGREVRSAVNLSLDLLGYLAVRVDMKALFRNYAQGMDTRQSQFLIWGDDGRLVYPEEPLHDPSELGPAPGNGRGYRITDVDGRRYFVTYVKSAHMDWHYMTLIPYDHIFKRIMDLRKLVVFVFVLVFIVTAFIAMRFVRSITGPIERLNAKMKRVQLAGFEAQDMDDGDEMIAMDEAGQMHRNFRMMVERIRELVNENYVKQLMIRETQFKALQAQINPHFLYNTLDSINWSAKMNGQRQISQMVESLGFLLRSSISLKEPLISLRHELDIVSHYVTIQQIRFEERLDFRLDVPEALTDAQIPKLSIQPLVENAVHYGVEQMIGTCVIRVSARLDGSDVLVSVEDDGPGMDGSYLARLKAGEVKPKGSGLGIANIDERIRLLFGERYGLTVESERGSGTRVHLRFPYKKEGS
ncbi:sensor histidine kinase [Paenibacillus cisolokensis]|uniref:cache domain-containing sensor histidine kinase n=1 Tax=Paenibacillus cisolokensis TaxID=1658519 RepID=UPI003D28CB99